MKRLIFLTVFFQSLFLFAQNGKVQFTNYTIDNGLSQSVVRAVYVDKNGIAWIGTDDGLNSFDGYEFEVYKTKYNDPFSISDNRIRLIWLEDSKNNLWIITSDGLLNKLNLKSKLCENYGSEFPDSVGFIQLKTSIKEAHNSDIWITSLSGLYKYKRTENKLIRYSHDPQNSASIADNVSWTSFQDSKNNIWVGTNNGISLYFPEKDEFKNYLSLDTASVSNVVAHFIETQNNDFYAVARAGIYKYNSQADKFEYFPFPVIHQERIRLIDFIFDNRGNIWVATNFGLFQFIIQSNEIIHQKYDPKNPNSISDDITLDLHLDDFGAVWFGTLNGLNEYNYETKNFTSYFQEVKGDFSNIITR